MSERYTRVFSLPENLYAVGSPVVISAGALLKDNQTGKVLAQLKLTNIQYKKIKAVKVKLFPLDTMGQSLGEAIDYQYLDLQLTRDGDFGSKTPIPFPDATARAFAVEVTAVVFSDNTAWNSDGTPWEPIPVSVPLHSKYNSLVIEQLRLEQNGTCQFVVQEHKDLWLCACGAVNHDGEARCHECGKQLSEIYPLDVEGLTERANLRLAEEARQAAEEKAAREVAAAATKKETAKILKIVIPVICIVVAFVILLNRVIIPNSTYSKAVSLMEAGKFEAAVTAFEAMDGYKDSAEQIVKCENAIAAAEQARIEAEMAAAYKVAEDLADKGEIAKAAIAFGELGGFRDAWERSIALWADIADWETVAGMDYQTLGLKIDGTVVAVGENTYGVCDVSGWKDIIDIDAGARHSVALMANGTVVAIGSNKDMLGKSEINQCDVSSWTNIVDICTGNYHTVGLKADGTVVAAGSNYDATGVHYFGQCQVDSWKDITAVSAGVCHTVGLKSDGTVVAVGSNEY